jgi:hypothetical protein
MQGRVIIFKPVDLLKAKKMPVGTVSRGRKKMAEGKWVPVKSGKPKTAGVDDIQEIVASLKGKFGTVVLNPTTNASFAKIKGLASKYGKNKAKKIMVALVEARAGSPAKAKPYIDVIKRIVDMAVRS